MMRVTVKTLLIVCWCLLVVVVMICVLRCVYIENNKIFKYLIAEIDDIVTLYVTHNKSI